MKLSTDFVDATISHDTLNFADLLTTYATFIENEVDPKSELAWELRHWLKQDEESHGEWNGVEHDETAHYLLDDCHNLFDDIAPAGTYFGAHEGNGSDFGFWTFEEQDEDPHAPDSRDVADFEANGYFLNPEPGNI